MSHQPTKDLQSEKQYSDVMPRYSRDDALSERKMELLIEVIRNLKHGRTSHH